ncbi:aldo/keto reductase [Alicyclobacillus vulcanalis]|uniref:Predicted oxidoreductase n=1 Tax=Alicyclobacillus vulcanalis TaxID=252246 RepID=A0A1N7NZT6_9BACL|nr:aldo/keto reductase [Alicyclobacillus vulcanalis]SIT03798.1 Predicted oxidoreductase [Alicyclobacillus vulcanalis]
MRQAVLGRSGIAVSEVGLGCMTLPTDRLAAVRILREAVDLGIRFFDTADLYGQGLNEEIVGEALAPVRSQVVIATKVGNRFEPGKPGWTWDPSPAYIERAIEDSLRRLRTDYIDLYQLHGGTMDDPFDDIVELMERFVEKGVIRAWGISSIRPNVIQRYLMGSNLATIMMQYSLLDRRPEEWFAAIEAKGVRVIARGPVASGWLTGKKVPQPGDTYLGYGADDLARAPQVLREVAPDRTPAQAAIQFSTAPGAVCCAIPGASRAEQLRENAEAGTLPPLTETELERLRAAYPAKVYTEHRPT